METCFYGHFKECQHLCWHFLEKNLKSRTQVSTLLYKPVSQRIHTTQGAWAGLQLASPSNQWSSTQATPSSSKLPVSSFHFKMWRYATCLGNGFIKNLAYKEICKASSLLHPEYYILQIKQIFTEHLLYARHCSDIWEYIVSTTVENIAFGELIFCRKM